jgi:Hypothetical glycosyl hydrolase family 15
MQLKGARYMKKTSLLIALVILFLLISNFSQAAFADATTIVPLPDTTNGIHVALVHESHTNVSDENGVIDYVWGARLPQPGHTSHKDFYFKFDRTGGDPGTHGFPVYYSKDWFLKNHPDWLVYLCNKTSLAYEYNDPQVPLDITNPAVRQFELDTWIKPALDKGYDGVSFDNVNLDNKQSAGRCGVWTTDSNGNQTWKYLYKDAKSIHGQLYVQSIVTWAKAMYTAIHAYNSAAVVTMNYSPNNTGNMHGTLAFNDQLNPYSDNMLDEGGFTAGFNHSPYTVDRYWQLEAGFALDLAAHGKGLVMVFGYNFSTLTTEQKQWALANYLLLKGNHTYMTISSGADNGSQYGHLNLIPEYAMNIGHPVNVMYQSQGVYMRDFSNGKTLLNPSSKKRFTVNIPAGTYKDVNGNPLGGNVTLGIHSGLVLLNVSAQF